MEVVSAIVCIVLFFVIEVFYLAPAVSWWVGRFAARKLRKKLDKDGVNLNDIMSQLVK